MASSLSPASATRHTNTTDETQIATGNCILFGIYPTTTTTGTVSLAAGVVGASTAFHVSAIGLTQAGKTFGPFGIKVAGGLTIDMTQIADDVLVVWMKAD